MADLRISQLPEITTATSSDIFPFTQFGITKRISFGNLNNALPLYTFVRNTSSTWGGVGVTGIIAAFSINGNNGLVGTLNSTEYIIPWNTVEYQTNPSIIEADNTTNNMIIKQTGTYLLDIAYASYDLTDPFVDYLRLRLRGNPFNPITTTVGGTLLDTIDEGFITTDQNGRSNVKGTRILRITEVPYYLVGTFVHSGGSATVPGGIGGYPVFENTTGTMPHMIVQKLA